MKQKFERYLRFNGEIRLGILLLLLILLPSFFLAYFSVRAIEAERVAYQQRIVEGYQRLAQFASAEIQDMIEEIGEAWLQKLQPQPFMTLKAPEQREILQRLVEEDPLITDAYLVGATGEVFYPADLGKNPASRERYPEKENIPDLENWLLRFRTLSEQAEDQEFQNNDPRGAIAIYQQIIDSFPVSRLRAIALNEMARIHMIQAEWQIAYLQYRELIEQYPDARDLNNLHLRFYAQYQCVIALENLGRMEEAMPALLDLYAGLLDDSDEVNSEQYEFFVERIQRYFERIIGAYPEKQAYYREAFRALQERKKKSIGSKYLVEKLQQRLSRAIVKRSKFRERFKFFSDYTAEQTYLVAYLLLGKSENHLVETALGLQINIAALKEQIFPQIMRKRKFPSGVVIAVLDEEKKLVMGEADQILYEPVVLQALRDPLEFWQLGIFPTIGSPLVEEGQEDLYFRLWGIFLLWLFILAGSVVVISKVRQQRKRSLQKTTFISSVSHELRTPLTSIKMFVDFLAKNQQLKTDPETGKYLRIIRGESERLSRLVENVLDYAKIERGVKQYQFEYEEAEAIIRSVADTFSYHAEMSGVKIELDLEGELPEIHADRHALSQALINLLANAVKYSVSRQPVRLSARVEGKQLIIRVKDRGIGIRKKDLKYIFDDYYRVEEGEAANIAGTGLGLPLVRHIVEAHGGEVAVESVYGEGSTFTIKLPLPEG